MDDQAGTTNGAESLSLKLEPALARALDQFIAERHPGISRAAAVVLALHQWAGANGYGGSAPTIRPEDLNASNDD